MAALLAAAILSTRAAAQGVEDPEVAKWKGLSVSQWVEGLWGREDVPPRPARVALASMSAEELHAVHLKLRERLAYESPGSRAGPLIHYVHGYAALAAGEHKEGLRVLTGLLIYDDWKAIAVEPLSRRALERARTGDKVGLKALDWVIRVYPKAAWAHANYALALRLVGDYDAAARAYARLLRVAGRKGWTLNESALLEHARGRSQKALDLLLEGARDASDPRGQDTCRGNAAMLLLLRGRASDRVRAAILLERAVARDPTRVRSRYWLEQLKRGGRLPDGGRYARVTLEPASGSKSSEGSGR